MPLSPAEFKARMDARLRRLVLVTVALSTVAAVALVVL